MTAEEVEHVRALLRAQAAPEPRLGLAQRVLRRVGGGGPALLGVLELDAPAPPRLVARASRPGSLFGRREPEPEVAPEPAPPRAPEPCGPLLLTTLLAPTPSAALPEPGRRVSLAAREEAGEATPATPPAPRDSSVTVAIGGWSVAPPPSARARRLARIAAVCAAERRGLDARLAGLGL